MMTFLSIRIPMFALTMAWGRNLCRNGGFNREAIDGGGCIGGGFNVVGGEGGGDDDREWVKSKRLNRIVAAALRAYVRA